MQSQLTCGPNHLNAICLMQMQLKFNLYVPLIDGGEQQLQPALVTDVSAAMLAALRSKETMGQTYHLGGPEVLRWVQVSSSRVRHTQLQHAGSSTGLCKSGGCRISDLASSWCPGWTSSVSVLCCSTHLRPNAAQKVQCAA